MSALGSWVRVGLSRVLGEVGVMDVSISRRRSERVSSCSLSWSWIWDARSRRWSGVVGVRFCSWEIRLRVALREVERAARREEREDISKMRVVRE